MYYSFDEVTGNFSDSCNNSVIPREPFLVSVQGFRGNALWLNGTMALVLMRNTKRFEI